VQCKTRHKKTSGVNFLSTKDNLMEIKLYLTMARRWAWLLITGLVLGAMVGLVVSILQSPVYQASTRILVMRAPQEKTNDYTYLSDQQLVQTYIQLLTTQPVLQKTSETLGSAVKASQVTVDQIGDTQAIQVTVEDENPQRASDIANILVQVLISQNEIIQFGRYASTEQSIQAQITQIENQIHVMGTEIENISNETVVEQQKQVEAQIAALQPEVTQLLSDIQTLKSSATPNQQAIAEKEARLNQVQPVLTLYQQTYTDLVVLGKPVTSNDNTTRLAQLQSTLQLYQQIYTNLLDNLESIRLARLQNTPNVVQIEAASPPSKPVRPQPITNTGLAAVVGLLLAGGIAFLIEYVDDTIRSPEDIERILKLPVIGYIGEMEVLPGEVADAHVLHHPRSPIAEAFRSLRTNLEFTNVDQNLTKILITSAGPSEGKTTIAINLATIIAQSGKRVLLIDADMRRPRVHTIFNISNKIGLSTLFRGNTPVQAVIRPVEGMENVFIMPSGSPPPNPTELLASAKMDLILKEASQLVDMIIVDSPPSLVADYQVLSTKLDGVLLIVQPGHTRADSASAMLEQLERVNGRALGVILNKITQDTYAYGGYHHYYYYRDKTDKYYALPEEQGKPHLSTPLPPRPMAALEQPSEQPMEFYIPPGQVNSYVEAAARHEQEPPRGRVEVYAPVKNMPAARPVTTKPKRQADFNPNETSSYIIQERQLEYWYDPNEEQV
jgi:capsular exopolysaccharide synthesis family protein